MFQPRHTWDIPALTCHCFSSSITKYSSRRGNENIFLSIWTGVSIFHIHCHYHELREENKHICSLLLSGYRSHTHIHTIHLIKLQTKPVSRQQYSMYFKHDSFCQQRPLTIFAFFLSLPSFFSFLRGIQTTWSYGWRFSSAPMSDAWMWTLKSHLQGNF